MRWECLLVLLLLVLLLPEVQQDLALLLVVLLAWEPRAVPRLDLALPVGEWEIRWAAAWVVAECQGSSPRQ